MWRLPSLALCISHPLPIPRILPCLRARVDVYECRGGKRSKVSPRGALNLPAARFLQTERFDPLFPPQRDGIARAAPNHQSEPPGRRRVGEKPTRLRENAWKFRGSGYVF